jgi:hypothetical protein
VDAAPPSLRCGIGVSQPAHQALALGYSTKTNLSVSADCERGCADPNARVAKLRRRGSRRRVPVRHGREGPVDLSCTHRRPPRKLDYRWTPRHPASNACSSSSLQAAQPTSRLSRRGRDYYIESLKRSPTNKGVLLILIWRQDAQSVTAHLARWRCDRRA